ncbi:unnamed protein product [Linum trigynum]|uniref:Trichome birefringence-like N-terminal domain-containing protein n=1 Tax=Linum trigynum TaxID=586398 RepID=A0AAV2FGI1_9ROSI
MAKNERQEEETTQLVDSGNNLKRLSLYDPPVAVLGIFLIILSVILCFIYLDYSEALGVVYRVPNWLQFRNDMGRRLDFLKEEGDGCNVFDGEWVWDDDYPLYLPKDCTFIEQSFNCIQNGRPDVRFTKWRWQPRECDLPRFDGKLLLEKLRNKRVVFAGDSLGRNQWESMLCLLASSAVANKDSVYEVNGNSIRKQRQGTLVFKFQGYNCTLEFYWSPYLVHLDQPSSGAPRSNDKVRSTLKLDRMDPISRKWRDADVLVLNSGHWWTSHMFEQLGLHFQIGQEVKMNMSMADAYRKSMETVMQWIKNEVNTNKTQIFFRTYEPRHFLFGEWNTGGRCHEETLPELGAAPVLSLPLWTHIQFELAANKILPNRTYDLLNITEMSARRKDGHMSVYYLSSHRAPMRRQDCSHWCLPGVPDSWNELLYAFILKRQATRP